MSGAGVRGRVPWSGSCLGSLHDLLRGRELELGEQVALGLGKFGGLPEGVGQAGNVPGASRSSSPAIVFRVAPAATTWKAARQGSVRPQRCEADRLQRHAKACPPAGEVSSAFDDLLL
jgi:hypothetical protein